MREIKFRGKRIDNGEWVYGDLIHRQIWSSKILIIRVNDNGFDTYEEHEVNPGTVGQYTGLKDKNGKEIYEGDIVRHHDDILSSVSYNSAHCAYVMADIAGNRNRCQCDKLGSYSSLWIEVVGNIYDDPERSDY